MEIRRILLFAVAALSLSSCVREESSEMYGDMVKSSISFQADPTKAGLWNGHIYWSVGENLSVCDKSGNRYVFTATTTDRTEATFEGLVKKDAADLKTAFPVVPDDTEFYDESTGLFSITVPSFQKRLSRENDIVPAYGAAKVNNGQASFINVGALISFSIRRSDIDVICLKSNSGVPLTGRASFSLESGAVDDYSVSDARDSVVLLPTDTLSYIGTGRIYLYVLPGEHSDGFTITCHNADGLKGTLKSTAKLTISRNGQYDFEDITDYIEWEPAGPANEPVIPPKTAEKPDYSLLTAANHPRLFADDSEFDAFIAKVNADDLIAKSSHDGFLSLADAAVAAEPLEIIRKTLQISTATTFSRFITSCVYAYRATGQQKYLDRAIADAEVLLGWEDWTKAADTSGKFADVSYIGPCDMCGALALLYDWCYSSLNDSFRTRLANKVNEYYPYCFSLSIWELAGNQCQVCAYGLGCAALAMYEKIPTGAAEVISRIRDGNPVSQNEMYSPEGNSFEGYAYWLYGMQREAAMLYAMEKCTGCDLGVPQIEPFLKSAQWYSEMDGTDFYCFNWGDCADMASGCNSPLFYFAWKYNYPEFVYGELKRAEKGAYSVDYSDIPLIVGIWPKMEALAVKPPHKHVNSWISEENQAPMMLYHKDFTRSSSDAFLGVKGGNASVAYNHMDAGSFVYHNWGTQWAADYGKNDYTKMEKARMTGDRQWQVYRLNNRNHNTLCVDNRFFAFNTMCPVTTVYDSPEGYGATVDLTPVLKKTYDEDFNAYPGLSNAVRTVKLVGDDLVVTDEITVDKDAISVILRWTMVTKAAVGELNPNDIRLDGNNSKKLYLHVKNPPVNIIYKQYDNMTGQAYDDLNGSFRQVGWEAQLYAGKSYTFVTVLTPDENVYTAEADINAGNYEKEKW